MPVQPPWPKDPWAHQQQEWERYRDDDARALLWQMRTGKTRATVDVAFYRAFDRFDVDGVLILAPNGVHVNWIRRQLPQHAWTGMPWRGYAWQASERTRPENVRAERELLAYRDGLPFLAVNSESLVNDDASKLIAKFLEKRRVMLIVDESHNFRTPGSRRTKRARALAKYCPVRRILTGTAIDNSPLAAYSQFELLRAGALGFGRFAEFEGFFAEYETKKTRGGRSYETLKAYRNLEVLRERMAQFSSVVLREDCEDMSGIIRDQRTVLMSDEQSRAYKSLLQEFILELENGVEIDALEAGVRHMKLQQVLSGFVIGNDGVAHDLVPDDVNPRLQALVDELQGSNDKAIVWCKFQEDIKRVVRALRKAGRNPVEYHGKIHSQAKRQEAVDAFQTDPTVTDFVGQPAAGGAGLDLSAADVIVWYSHTFDLIERSQADERASAVGGKAIVVKDFVVPNSADEYILANLEAKRDVREMVTGRGLRDHLLATFRKQL